MVRGTCQFLSLVFATLVILPILGCPLQAPTTTGNDTNQVDESLAVFTDSESSLRTNDVYDVNNEVVQFDPATSSMIWVGTGVSFPGYPVDGDLVRSDGYFKVRFGTVEGARRAFFTETAAATICDVQVNNGALAIYSTNVTVPQE